MITKGFGCLLAHTMGLGKTLQIIALLITLSLLPSDAKVEMPTHLKKTNRRYLIVCPPSIVINWRNEFKKWTPYDCKEALGPIFCVNQIGLLDRMHTIRRWYRHGGVLLGSAFTLSMSLINIVGYSQFRALLNPNKK